MDFLDRDKLEAAIRKEAHAVADDYLVAPTAADYLYTETAMLRAAVLILMAAARQEIAEAKAARQANGEEQKAD